MIIHCREHCEKIFAREADQLCCNILNRDNHGIFRAFAGFADRVRAHQLSATNDLLTAIPVLDQQWCFECAGEEIICISNQTMSANPKILHTQVRILPHPKEKED